MRDGDIFLTTWASIVVGCLLFWAFVIGVLARLIGSNG